MTSLPEIPISPAVSVRPQALTGKPLQGDQATHTNLLNQLRDAGFGRKALQQILESCGTDCPADIRTEITKRLSHTDQEAKNYRVARNSQSEVPPVLSSANSSAKDSLGFLVRKALKIRSGLELDDPVICIQENSFERASISDIYLRNKLRFRFVDFPSLSEAVKAYDSGRCDAMGSTIFQLQRLLLATSNSDEHVLIPVTINR